MKISTVTGQTALDAVKALMNGGSLKIYNGTEPTDPDTALSSNTLLATFTFSATAFGSDSLVSSNEQATGSLSASTVTAAASGSASFARVFESDGTTVVCDLTVGTSGTDVVLNSTTITSGGNVTITSLVLKMPVH